MLPEFDAKNIQLVFVSELKNYGITEAGSENLAIVIFSVFQ